MISFNTIFVYWKFLCSGMVTLFLVFGIPLTALFVSKQFLFSDDSKKNNDSCPSVLLYRLEENGYKQLKQYTTVHTLDSLQVAYTAGGRKCGIIFSVNGDGVVRQHFPEGTKNNDSLQGTLLQEGEQKLHSLVILDNAQLFERFYFLTSNESIDVPSVLEKCREYFQTRGAYAALRIPSLPSAIDQHTFTLKKN